MAVRFRVYWKNAKIYGSGSGIPTGTAAGAKADDPIVLNAAAGNLVGVNLWGTGKGQGVKAGYAMIAHDGVTVQPVNIVTTAVVEGTPIYITSANALTNVATSNTLFGYADEPGAVGAATKIGVNIKSQVNV